MNQQSPKSESPKFSWAYSPQKNNPLRESMSPEFIPFGYSSPLNSFGKRGQNFNKRGHSRMYQDRSGNGSFTSPSSNCSSSYSPYNKSGRFNRSNDYHSHRGGFRGNRNSPRFSNPNDISLYFHKSMIEDPWQELEEELKRKSENEEVQNESKEESETN